MSDCPAIEVVGGYQSGVAPVSGQTRPQYSTLRVKVNKSVL
ncbi:hypothetical protein KIPB_014843, partial [Kipferlia bialata]|eukprot:g14843.t1